MFCNTSHNIYSKSLFTTYHINIDRHTPTKLFGHISFPTTLFIHLYNPQIHSIKEIHLLKPKKFPYSLLE